MWMSLMHLEKNHQSFLIKNKVESKVESNWVSNIGLKLHHDILQYFWGNEINADMKKSHSTVFF